MTIYKCAGLACLAMNLISGLFLFFEFHFALTDDCNDDDCIIATLCLTFVCSVGSGNVISIRFLNSLVFIFLPAQMDQCVKFIFEPRTYE